MTRIPLRPGDPRLREMERALETVRLLERELPVRIREDPDGRIVYASWGGDGKREKEGRTLMSAVLKGREPNTEKAK